MATGPDEQQADVDAAAAALASPVRRAIVTELEGFAHGAGASWEASTGPGGMTAAQLAQELDLHVSTVRFHLDHLESAGLVLSHFTTAFGVGRPRKVYAVAPAPREVDRSVAHLTLLADLLSGSYTSGVSPEEAGEQWVQEHVDLRRTAPAATAGDWLAKLGSLIDVLRHWGYTPNLSTTDNGRSCRIDLVDCPFMGLARANPDVVCGIHRGLVTGALEQMGEDHVEVSLQPFVKPGLCQAHISTRQSFESPTEESSDEP